MAQKPPRTYDEIVARTVPEPDSSFRPTAQQREDTRNGLYLIDEEDRELIERVAQELGRAGYRDLTVEARGGAVVLRGAVAEPAAMRAAEQAVAGLDGVRSVDNQLHIAATG